MNFVPYKVDAESPVQAYPNATSVLLKLGDQHYSIDCAEPSSLGPTQDGPGLFLGHLASGIPASQKCTAQRFQEKLNARATSDPLSIRGAYTSRPEAVVGAAMPATTVMWPRERRLDFVRRVCDEIIKAWLSSAANADAGGMFPPSGRSGAELGGTPVAPTPFPNYANSTLPLGNILVQRATQQAVANRLKQLFPGTICVTANNGGEVDFAGPLASFATGLQETDGALGAYLASGWGYQVFSVVYAEWSPNSRKRMVFLIPTGDAMPYWVALFPPGGQFLVGELEVAGTPAATYSKSMRVVSGFEAVLAMPENVWGTQIPRRIDRGYLTLRELKMPVDPIDTTAWSSLLAGPDNKLGLAWSNNGHWFGYGYQGLCHHVPTEAEMSQPVVGVLRYGAHMNNMANLVAALGGAVPTTWSDGLKRSLKRSDFSEYVPRRAVLCGPSVVSSWWASFYGISVGARPEITCSSVSLVLGEAGRWSQLNINATLPTQPRILTRTEERFKVSSVSDIGNLIWLQYAVSKAPGLRPQLEEARVNASLNLIQAHDYAETTGYRTFVASYKTRFGVAGTALLSIATAPDHYLEFGKFTIEGYGITPYALVNRQTSAKTPLRANEAAEIMTTHNLEVVVGDGALAGEAGYAHNETVSWVYPAFTCSPVLPGPMLDRERGTAVGAGSLRGWPLGLTARASAPYANPWHGMPWVEAAIVVGAGSSQVVDDMFTNLMDICAEDPPRVGTETVYVFPPPSEWVHPIGTAQTELVRASYWVSSNVAKVNSYKNVLWGQAYLFDSDTYHDTNQTTGEHLLVPE